MKSVIFGAFFAASIFAFACADEQTTVLAANGDWMAGEHSDSITDPPDVCIAFDENSGLGFRVDQNDVEVRYSNDSWSLPDNVSGSIDIKVGSDDFPFGITSNTNNQVVAVITQDQLEKMVGDMNTASSMTIAAGSSPAAQVSLIGSNQVITAFLTCAGLPQPGSTGGSNPFASPSQ